MSGNDNATAFEDIPEDAIVRPTLRQHFEVLNRSYGSVLRSVGNVLRLTFCASSVQTLYRYVLEDVYEFPTLEKDLREFQKLLRRRQ